MRNVTDTVADVLNGERANAGSEMLAIVAKTIEDLRKEERFRTIEAFSIATANAWGIIHDDWSRAMAFSSEGRPELENVLNQARTLRHQIAEGLRIIADIQKSFPPHKNDLKNQYLQALHRREGLAQQLLAQEKEITQRKTA